MTTESMNTTTATARAHPNIALVKYWGKRDRALMLPAAGSLSLTLDVFPTTTTIDLVDADEDAVVLNGSPAPAEFTRRVRAFLDLVREMSGSEARASVDTHNTVPTGAGLASSASGYAAMAVAAAAAYGLDLDAAGLSRLARRGSGSATRSILPGLAMWAAGEDDETSIALPVEGPELAMVVAVLDDGEKPMSSRDAMVLTAQTSPYYDGWVASTAADLDLMRAALAADDFTAVGEITESNALRMHAAIMGCRPPVRYLSPKSFEVFDLLASLRADGLEVYGTADAGPNVVAVCRLADLERVEAALAAADPSLPLVAARPGPGAHLIDPTAVGPSEEATA